MRRALTVLIGTQGVINMCNSATQQLVVLRLLSMLSSGVAAVSGIGFGLAGVASSVSAVLFTSVARRLGYIRTAAGAAGMVAIAVAVIGVAPWVSVVVIAMGLNGLFSGVVIPATASMIGLEAPPETQSTIFGINASAVSFGFFLGPLIAGGVAATTNVSVSLLVVAAMALGLAAVFASSAREPAR